MTGWPANRLILSAAAVTEGAILASFGASISILLGRHGYALSGIQYGAVFMLQVITAAAAALIGVRSARRLSRGRALRFGFGLSIAALLLLIGALAPRPGPAAQLSLLLVGGILVGGGFGLVYPALTAFALDSTPNHAERAVLGLNLMLAVGLAVSPGLEVAAERTGVWWALQALLCGLGLLIMMVASRPRLGPDAARSCNLNLPGRWWSARYTVYPVLALLAGVCAVTLAGWAQIQRAGQAVPYSGFSILVLASFWAAAVIAARVAFVAMERRQTWQRSASLVPFLVAAAIAVTGLALGQVETARVGIFLLAAVLCAAFFPLPASARADGLMLLSLVGAAGVVGLYPAALGMAGPSVVNFQSRGISLLGIFVVTGSIGVAATLVATRLRAWWRASAVGPEASSYRRGGDAVPLGAQVSSAASEPKPADRTTQSAPRPRQDMMPPHSRSASSATPSSKSE